MSTPSLTAKLSWEDILRAVTSQQNHNLWELSNLQPVLVVFLRHSGCTFCREALAEISEARKKIEAEGVQLAIVHMGDEESFSALAERYSLDDVERFCDPAQTLHQAFEIRRGSIWQVIGPQVWWRGFIASLLKRHSFGRIRGDVYQLPGATLLNRGEIIARWQGKNSADKPNYADLACSTNSAD